MAKDLVCHALDVFRDRKSAAVDQCGGLRDLEEVDGRAGAGADPDVLGKLLVDVGGRLTGGGDNVGYVFLTEGST